MADGHSSLDSTVELLGSGAKMPLLGIGTWQLRGSSGREAIAWALETGYRHVDTATMYGNEAEVGAAVAGSGLNRSEVFITTKMPPEAAGGRERRTLEQSLRALGTGYVDLWLIHWPPRGGGGVGAWREFVRAQADGLARSIGVSNFSTGQIDRLTAETGVTPPLNQIRWSPFLFDPGLVAASRERNVVIEGYSPFKSGRLDHRVITGIADRHAKTPTQVVVRWHLQNGIGVIPKSVRRERIAANADVFDFELTPEDMTSLDALGGSR